MTEKAETLYTGYRECESVLRDKNMKQALYEAGKVVMKDVLLTLHGDAHKLRRRIELRVFRRSFFRYYEQEVFPRTLEETLRPMTKTGRLNLIDFGYRVTINLTADFAGVDRADRTEEETETLLGMIKTFSDGATLVHSKRDKSEVEDEVRLALKAFWDRFVKPSVSHRKKLLAQVASGELSKDDLPRDVLTVMLDNEEQLELSDEIITREMAFYMQAGAHSTANATVHSMHEIFTWAGDNADRWARINSDPCFVHRCVHESFRLHPASPDALRRVCPLHMEDDATDGPLVKLDLFQANRDKTIFGEDADIFRPERTPKGTVPASGLSFGTGTHSCLGVALDGGVLMSSDKNPEEREYGIVTLLILRLLELGAKPDPDELPSEDPLTTRPNWGRYPIILQNVMEN